MWFWFWFWKVSARWRVSGYGPSHTWEGYRGHGGGSGTAGGGLRLQAEGLQRVIGRVDFSFFYGCTQLNGREGMSADRTNRSHAQLGPLVSGLVTGCSAFTENLKLTTRL